MILTIMTNLDSTTLGTNIYSIILSIYINALNAVNNKPKCVLVLPPQRFVTLGNFNNVNIPPITNNK